MRLLRGIATGIASSALLFSATAMNITLEDGNTQWEPGYYWDAAWMGTPAEDNEVEPGCETGQNWDLEAFLLNGTTLTVVGGYDLKNGYDGTYTGDLFVDIGGEAGYDFVYDINWLSGSYGLYSVDQGTVSNISMYPERIINASSNPVGFTAAANQTALRTGSMTYQSGITSGSALVSATGDEDAGALKGAKNWNSTKINDKHNVASFDVSYFAGEDAVFHLTMSCGNDDLKGGSSVPVPEPGAVSLFTLGLVCLGGCFLSRRKR